MFQLKIITASTRPGRKGPAVTSWIEEIARKHPAFEVTVLDLLEINLPMFNEPNHPRMQKYEHAHTKKWSELISGADAFIFVMPEYNYGYTAPLKNALDYLAIEWQYKAVGFVSYGGIAGGTRAVQLLKPVLTTVKMVPVTEAVAIPMFTKYMDDQEKFVGDELLIKGADDMLNELAKWTKALKTIR